MRCRSRRPSPPRAFAPYNILWFEEPIIPDDYQGYAQIAVAPNNPGIGVTFDWAKLEPHRVQV